MKIYNDPEDALIISDFSNQISQDLFFEKLKFSPDKWDVSGAAANIAEAASAGLVIMLDSWKDVSAYKERMYALAEKQYLERVLMPPVCQVLL